jgi:hypothetical protein
VNQPGLEDVFADLLEYEDRTGEELGAELYMEHTPPHLEGTLKAVCPILLNKVFN